jgi:hypothetical protein
LFVELANDDQTNMTDALGLTSFGGPIVLVLMQF